ncbi:MAG TPA: signal peptidase I [Acidimicrobiales bacterium]|nr:signal peptidase I [Acidimicrobiales bacterium]
MSPDPPTVAEVETEEADQDPSGARRARRRTHARRNIIEWTIVVVGALIVAVVIKTFLFQAFYIPSVSMEPTLKVGDRVLVNKLSYKLHDVHRGDIVVFGRPPTDPQTVEGCDGKPVTITPQKNTEEVHDLIKRVVALGGETVEARGGKLFVNGELLNEPYLSSSVTTPAFESSAFPVSCIRVPKGDVFVLGDNRTNSAASNRFGPISENLIVGRAFVRVWPIGSVGGI